MESPPNACRPAFGQHSPGYSCAGNAAVALMDGRNLKRAPFVASKRKSAPEGALLNSAKKIRQRLENWNERRAFARPYFLRSTTRLSRVKKPPRFSAPRRSGSK